MSPTFSMFIFFNDTATTEIYTLSLHDALPISTSRVPSGSACVSSTAWSTRASSLTGRIGSPRLVRLAATAPPARRSEERTPLLQSPQNLEGPLLCLNKKKLYNRHAGDTRLSLR